MSTEQYPDEETLIRALYNSVSKQLAEGARKGKIVETLVKGGWPRDFAVRVVDEVQGAMRDYRASPEGRQVLSRKYAELMGTGLTALVAGGLITAATYYWALLAGGGYIIAVGAFFWGTINLLRGFFGWLKYRP